MKKILLFSLISLHLVGNMEKQNAFFNGALSAGYVFKHDCRFKEVYGHGIVNILTADGCFFPWDVWGIGVKLSYWRAKGHTNFYKQRAILQQVPVTAYVRRIKDFNCGLQLYGSLGAGLVWAKEKSYFADEHFTKGVGEVEVGLNYNIWRCMNIGAAFRYIFPPQSQEGHRVDVGGCDLRAGIGFSF